MNIEPLNEARSNMAKAKKRRKWKRPSVDRAERTAATPETLAKLRVCSLLAMVHAGQMEPDEYEAALEVWEAHRQLSGQLEAKGSNYSERTDPSRDMGGNGHVVSVYLDWSREIMRRYWLMPGTVIGWIEDRDPGAWMVNDVQRRLLVKACRTWIDVADDARRDRRFDKAEELAL